MVSPAEVGTNRRVVVNAIDDVVFETVPETPPAGGEVRIRSTIIGICGSDLNVACGNHPFIDLPYRPGHEVVGGRAAATVGDLRDRPAAVIDSVAIQSSVAQAVDLVDNGGAISARFDFEHSAEAFSASADAENVTVAVSVS